MTEKQTNEIIPGIMIKIKMRHFGGGRGGPLGGPAAGVVAVGAAAAVGAESEADEKSRPSVKNDCMPE